MSSNKQPGLPTEVSYNEAVEASKKYFDGDDLAATVWVSKYALKDSYGHIYEKTPRDMHERIAAEIERIEKKYPNPMNRQEVFELLDHFRYIIPQGGPMTGIGNNFQAASLSNCFVIGHKNPADSYGGISRLFNEEFWNYAKLISGVLRHGMPITNVVSLIESLHLNSETINTWKLGVERALKQYISDGTKTKDKCPSCGQETMAYQNGCLTCMSCGYSKCG